MMNDVATTRRTRRDAAQGAVVAAAFSLLLAGTNAVNPVLPVYREYLGVDAFVLSLTFVCYVVVLVAVLVVLARPRFTRHAPALLVAGLAVAIASDLLLALGVEWSILTGRAVAGVAGGLATGAASALVVAAIGVRGRALAATGNLVGAVLGTAASQLVVELLRGDAAHAVFLGHAAALGVVLVAAVVVLLARAGANRAALAAIAGPVERVALRRGDLPLFATGCVGWAALSVAIVFTATAFTDLEEPLVRAAGSTLMLVASAAGQLASPALARVLPRLSGLGLVAGGAVLVIGGGLLHAPLLALAGLALLGAGVGISYRTGLVALTRGASPARQGALSSGYAAAPTAPVTRTVAAILLRSAPRLSATRTEA